ncbi:MAG: hypothetical protein LBI64_03075 [Coriobacteriales bacterium]|jgi:hypothetical protein|nr:hypothetical protein [Coriobacteriales bacterium]
MFYNIACDKDDVVFDSERFQAYTETRDGCMVDFIEFKDGMEVTDEFMMQRAHDYAPYVKGGLELSLASVASELESGWPPCDRIATIYCRDCGRDVMDSRVYLLKPEKKYGFTLEGARAGFLSFDPYGPPDYPPPPRLILDVD